MSTAVGARSERAVRWTPQASQKCRVGDPGRSFLLKDLGVPLVNWKLLASTAKGTPRSFNKNDRPGSPTRHFCGACGVHLTARSERAPAAVLIKVGTLDDPSVFEGPQLV